MELYFLIPMVAVIAGAAFVGGWYLNVRTGRSKLTGAEERAKRIVEEADRDAAALKREKLLEVKDEWYMKKKEFEKEAKTRRNKLQAFVQSKESAETVSWPCRACGHHTRFLSTETERELTD